ncbi:MAG: hypothetical protein R3F51_03530 [Cyanobacteriota/Melainabacteria group bacterium]
MARHGEVNIESNHDSATATAGDHGISMAHAECWPGGPIVSNPQDCRDIDRTSNVDGFGFPKLDLSQLSTNDTKADSATTGIKPLDGNPILRPSGTWVDPQLDS